jgi:hypothetical protein
MERPQSRRKDVWCPRRLTSTTRKSGARRHERNSL